MAFHNEVNPIKDRYSGGEGSLYGPVPPAGTLKLTRQGTAVVNTDAAGNTILYFADALFPNALVSLIVTSGDASAWTGNATPFNFTRGSAWIACRNPTPVSGTVRLNYAAWGW